MSYPGYQCFKTDRETVYCSLGKIESYDDGRVWVEAACANFGLKADQLHDKPYVSMRQPANAIIWPFGATIRRIWPS